MASIDIISLHMNKPRSSLDIIRNGFNRLETMNAEKEKAVCRTHVEPLQREARLLLKLLHQVH